MATESLQLNQHDADDVRPSGRTSSFWRRLRPLLIWACLLSLGWLYFKWMEPPIPVAPPAFVNLPGPRLIYRYECGRCHTIAALPGVSGHNGPPLDGVGQRALGRVPGLSGRDYLRQCLREPGKVVVRGYLNVMPSFQHLSEAEIQELVDYLSRL